MKEIPGRKEGRGVYTGVPINSLRTCQKHKCRTVNNLAKNLIINRRITAEDYSYSVSALAVVLFCVGAEAGEAMSNKKSNGNNNRRIIESSIKRSMGIPFVAKRHAAVK